MIELTENADALLTVASGDVVAFNGTQLVVEKTSDEEIYLTTLDSRVNEWLLLDSDSYFIYHEYVHHLRNDVGYAAMSCEEMIESIKNGTAYIG